MLMMVMVMVMVMTCTQIKEVCVVVVDGALPGVECISGRASKYHQAPLDQYIGVSVVCIYIYIY